MSFLCSTFELFSWSQIVLDQTQIFQTSNCFKLMTGQTSNSLEPRFIHQNWTSNPFELQDYTIVNSNCIYHNFLIVKNDRYRLAACTTKAWKWNLIFFAPSQFVWLTVLADFTVDFFFYDFESTQIVASSSQEVGSKVHHIFAFKVKLLH